MTAIRHRDTRSPRVRPARLERSEILLALVTGGIGLAAVAFAGFGAFLFLN